MDQGMPLHLVLSFKTFAVFATCTAVNWAKVISSLAVDIPMRTAETLTMHRPSKIDRKFVPKQILRLEGWRRATRIVTFEASREWHPGRRW